MIIVSHDRHFLDRLVDHLFVFCGDGVVKDFIGSYSEYNEYIKEYEARKRQEERAVEKPKPARPEAQRKKKLSYKEQRELEQIEKDLETLGNEKKELESKLAGGTLSYDKLQAASARFGELSALLDEKEMRWLELQD